MELGKERRYVMVIDLARCVNCQACVVACKMANGTPPGIFLTRVLYFETGEYPRARIKFFPVLCNQCQNAPCKEVCPAGAIYTEDGVVLIDKEKCTGCGMCAEVCPYNMITMIEPDDLKKGYWGDGILTPFEIEKYAKLKPRTPIKCTFCIDRVREGKKPLCVLACPSGARIFGDLNDPHSEVSILLASKRAWQPHPEFGTNPSVYYID
jgi:molybdopterin-containing oxidoreductase family iron-sulfur binding subunit